MAAFQLLPTELLDEIINYLSVPAPSTGRLHLRPSTQIPRDPRDLKNLSRTCSRLSKLVRPSLFTHGQVDSQDVDEYLDFLTKSGLCPRVKSLVLRVQDSCDSARIWRLLSANPRLSRLTLIAPPATIAKILALEIEEEHVWAFEIRFQTVHLECDRSSMQPVNKDCSSLLDALPWSSFLFNESSSLKAYKHYEYFLYKVPSIFGPTCTRTREHSALKKLTSFTYVALFPFYNHLQGMLEAVDRMSNLRFWTVQLAPSKNDTEADLSVPAPMDPNDMWMELATGYAVIAHAVRLRGSEGCLEKFTACDYYTPAIREEVNRACYDVLDNGLWTHDGCGTWTKVTDRFENGLTA
ncbi:hypothetical protein BDV18DRAFT_56145 [Aspergillus unguis]